jgi:hypothetical protein
MTAMIFATILAAGMFSLVFIGLGGEERVSHILTNMPGGPVGALMFCMAFVFVLGFFLDFVEISVIVLPLIAPTLIVMGHDPIWLGVLLGDQPADQLPDPAFRLFAVLPARCRSARNHHRADLRRRYPLHRPADNRHLAGLDRDDQIHYCPEHGLLTRLAFSAAAP